MTVKELKAIINDLSDDTEIEINSIWSDELQGYNPSTCSGFYHETDNKVYLTPEIINL